MPYGRSLPLPLHVVPLPPAGHRPTTHGNSFANAGAAAAHQPGYRSAGPVPGSGYGVHPGDAFHAPLMAPWPAAPQGLPPAPAGWVPPPAAVPQFSFPYAPHAAPHTQHATTHATAAPPPAAAAAGAAVGGGAAAGYAPAPPPAPPDSLRCTLVQQYPTRSCKCFDLHLPRHLLLVPECGEQATGPRRIRKVSLLSSAWEQSMVLPPSITAVKVRFSFDARLAFGAEGGALPAFTVR